MIVHRSPYSPRHAPPKRDPFAGRLRQALGEARKRRVPVTLPQVRGLAMRPHDADRGGRDHA